MTGGISIDRLALSRISDRGRFRDVPPRLGSRRAPKHRGHLGRGFILRIWGDELGLCLLIDVDCSL